MSKPNLASLVAGLLFGAGLVLSGMTDPAKVIGFLDVMGDWDPSLMLVMVGAIGVHLTAYFLLIRRRPTPLLVPRFHLKTTQRIDTRLLLGAAVFGFGWGMAGYCPGPGVVSVGAGSLGALVFVAGMISGMLLFRVSTQKREEPAKVDPTFDSTCG